MGSKIASLASLVAQVALASLGRNAPRHFFHDCQAEFQLPARMFFPSPLVRRPRHFHRQIGRQSPGDGVTAPHFSLNFGIFYQIRFFVDWFANSYDGST